MINKTNQVFQLYFKFQQIQDFIFRITLPYIFIVGIVGLVTNIFTVFLLSNSYATKNLKHKWALIALGLYKNV